MTPEEEKYANMTLDEFIAQPDVVDFAYIYTNRFRHYIEGKPYIKVGTILEAGGYVIAYTTLKYIDQVLQDLGSDFSGIYPQLLEPLGVEANTASGITAVRQQPFLGLQGQGVILGFVDTGIDYTKSTFKYEDGTSKIKYIWDQTIPGNPPQNIRFGSVYTQENINEALSSPNPFAVVPSFDAEGHGTFLASIAGGREPGEYIGAAPDAEIIAVKLKPSNKYHVDMFNLSGLKNIYSSTDFLLGIKFILDRAGEMNRPVVICIGMGSNFGSHAGDTLFEEYLATVTRRVGIIVVSAAGNEGNKKHHTEGIISRTGSTGLISINVGENISTVTFYVWNKAYDKISLEIMSPIGETTSRIPVRYGISYVNRLKLENSIISVMYYTGNRNLAIVTIKNPTVGIWNAKLYGDYILDGKYNSWMQISSSPDVEFLEPTPNTTIVIPATSSGVICCGAYSSFDNSLYISSSWGPTAEPRTAPDFVAPGVDIRGVYPIGYGTMTGTSVAAAITAGACALLLEWGIVKGNEISMDLNRIRSLLIGGCIRSEGVQYPNAQSGYGRLNLFESFNFLKEF